MRPNSLQEQKIRFFSQLLFFLPTISHKVNLVIIVIKLRCSPHPPNKQSEDVGHTLHSDFLLLLRVNTSFVSSFVDHVIVTHTHTVIISAKFFNENISK